MNRRKRLSMWAAVTQTASVVAFLASFAHVLIGNNYTVGTYLLVLSIFNDRLSDYFSAEASREGRNGN